jgi:peptide/nickel transport system substrate-binding protein
MKKKSVTILVISLIVIAGGTTGILLWGDFGSESDLNVAYYAYPSEPILNWDPSICYSDGLIVLNNVYETLLKFDPSTEEFEGVLATSYTQSDDGLKWNFTLREGVTFHDGTAFNASAVKYSIDRTLELDQGAAFIWYNVNNIIVLDEYLVQFNLTYATSLDIIAACPYAAFIMSPTAIGDNETWFDNGNECGTGPYQLESTVAGDSVVLAKYDEYWGGWDDNKNQFDKVVIKKHYETSVRRSMVEKGDADIVGYLPPTDIDALKNVDNVTVSDNQGFTNMLAHFNTEVAPLDNVKVRQALAYMFPYQDVVDNAAGGYANQSTGVIPAGLWGHNDSLFQYDYDKTQAEALFVEAGVDPNGLTLDLTYTSGDEAQRITAELYQAKLAEIGVTLTITGMPWTSQWEKAQNENPDDRQDIYMIYWWPDLSSPFSWLYGQYMTEYDILFNLAYYSNDTVDDYIYWADEVSATDRPFAEEIYSWAQEIIIEDCPSIFIYDQRDVFVISDTFEGFNYNPSYPNTVFFYECYRGE